MELNIHRGDVFYIQGPSYCVGSEMSKTRPAVVVSNEKNNIYAPLVEIVYLTTAEKKPLPTHVPITIYGRKNTVLCESVYTVSKERIGSYLCTLDSDEMALVDAALLISLGLSAPALAVAAAEEPPLPSSPCGLVELEAIPLESDTERDAAALREKVIRLEAQNEIYEKICSAYISSWPKGAAI